MQDLHVVDQPGDAVKLGEVTLHACVLAVDALGVLLVVPQIRFGDFGLEFNQALAQHGDLEICAGFFDATCDIGDFGGEISHRGELPDRPRP
ncbi:MAG: hypothetical protein RL532_981 [Actinomycetota bacterium]